MPKERGPIAYYMTDVTAGLGFSEINQEYVPVELKSG